ncbi:MAG TPA: hypothetical protein VF069_24610 [Streptosporangiaceae bacterium]
MLVELRLRRLPPPPRHDSPIDGIRVLAGLPAHWRKSLCLAGGDVIIKVRTDDDVFGMEIRDKVTGALRALAADWELVAFDVRSSSPPWPAARPGTG